MLLKKINNLNRFNIHQVHKYLLISKLLVTRTRLFKLNVKQQIILESAKLNKKQYYNYNIKR